MGKIVKRFEKKVWLASSCMHGDELKYMKEAYETNWMSTVGENLNAVEEQLCKRLNCPYCVALSSGTAALHMAVKLAGERVYGRPEVGHGVLEGKRVFCSDMTFDATVNPIVYEGGIPVFIDTEYTTWNMDPETLRKAFEIYPEIKIVMLVHLYGTPAKIEEIKEICREYGALIIEDAAEALNATYEGDYVGGFGDYGVISFNGNKLITGSSGGVILLHSKEDADKVRKWTTQAREEAPWYQHEEIGYNYRMSNVIAGVVRGQLPYIQDHTDRKKAIYDRYQQAFLEAELPVHMNPYEQGKSVPNYWLSCMLIDRDAMCKQTRSDREALYITESGKSCPTEILEALDKINAEGRPIWKPMHAQPIYKFHPFITRKGDERAKINAYIDNDIQDVGMDIFDRGLCLPSDINMTVEQQECIIEVIKDCFR